MAPRTMPLPSAQTESAREARRAFFCELCGKGYARVTEWEAHESSYDHQHRKRMKDMKALTRNTASATKASQEPKRRRENADMVSISLNSDPNAPKRGFKDINTGKREDSTSKTVASSTAMEDVRMDEKKAEEEEVKWEMRPIAWEELDRLDEWVDMKTNRPPQWNDAYDPQRVREPAELERLMKEIARYEQEL